MHAGALRKEGKVKGGISNGATRGAPRGRGIAILIVVAVASIVAAGARAGAETTGARPALPIKAAERTAAEAASGAPSAAEGAGPEITAAKWPAPESTTAEGAATESAARPAPAATRAVLIPTSAGSLALGVRTVHRAHPVHTTHRAHTIEWSHAAHSAHRPHATHGAHAAHAAERAGEIRSAAHRTGEAPGLGPRAETRPKAAPELSLELAVSKPEAHKPGAVEAGLTAEAAAHAADALALLRPALAATGLPARAFVAPRPIGVGAAALVPSAEAFVEEPLEFVDAPLDLAAHLLALLTGPRAGAGATGHVFIVVITLHAPVNVLPALGRLRRRIGTSVFARPGLAGAFARRLARLVGVVPTRPPRPLRLARHRLVARK